MSEDEDPFANDLTTPEGVALEAGEALECCYRIGPTHVKRLVANIHALIAAEREACAKLAESYDMNDIQDVYARVIPEEIASLIRARGKEGT